MSEVFYRLPGPELTKEEQDELRKKIKKCFIPIEYDGVLIAEVCNGDYFPFYNHYSQEEQAMLIYDFVTTEGFDRDFLEAIENMDYMYGKKERKRMIEKYICNLSEEIVQKWVEEKKQTVNDHPI